MPLENFLGAGGGGGAQFKIETHKIMKLQVSPKAGIVCFMHKNVSILKCLFKSRTSCAFGETKLKRKGIASYDI